MDTWEYEVRTFLTNWNEELMKHSIPTMFFPLSAEEREQYLSLMFTEGNTDEQQSTFTYFKEKIAPAFETFSDGIFLRNDRRSPKDSESFFTQQGILPAKSPAEAIAFTLYSERTYMDFKEAQRHNHLPVLVARKWMDFSREREFRCFMKEGRLVAITQYYHQDKYDWILLNKECIQLQIEGFFEEIKHQLSQLADTIVFDVHVGKNIVLIETNPYGLSDPCLFDYNELDSLAQDGSGTVQFKVKEDSIQADTTDFMDELNKLFEG